jgi:hypothetical protein
MARQCLFCSNTASSREHIWSDWILKDLKPATSIRIRIGERTDRWASDAEIKVNCVCSQCNNGWMSDLENENKPCIGQMINDEATILEPPQQKLLARWAILKAMVIEAANREKAPFYDREERFGLKPPSSLFPVRTSVWIGRLSSKNFHAGGTELWRQEGGIVGAVHGCVTTIVVGHLVIQLLTVHSLVIFATRPLTFECIAGAWPENLLDIWPVFGTRQWPPRLAFDLSRGQDGIKTLVDKWKIGTNLGRT